VVLAKSKGRENKNFRKHFRKLSFKRYWSLAEFKTKGEIIKIAEFLSTQVGNLLNYQELSKVSNLKYRTVIKHLEILKNTFLVATLKPFYKNTRTELVKVPKVYFLITGFAIISFQILERSIKETT